MESDGNKQIIISGEDTPEQGESSDVPADEDPPAQAHQDRDRDRDRDREYGCRYCLKKFSNKQALGGHQNAHKVERSMEKNINMQETDTATFYDGPNPYPYPYPYPPPPPPRLPAPFLASYHRDFLQRSLLSWGGYNPCPPPPPPLPLPLPLPPHGRLAPARPHYAHNINVRLPNFGPGTSTAFRPLQGPPGFLIRPGPINLRNLPGNHHDESGLDLSLKLG